MRLGNWVVRGGLLAGLCVLAACGSSSPSAMAAKHSPDGAAPAPGGVGPVQPLWTVTNGTPRFGHTATLLGDGRVLLTGGVTPSGATASTELLDPSSLDVTSGASMSIDRRWHTATMLLNGKVLVAGGWDSTGNHLASAELYDPVQGTWSPVESMDTPRWNHTATRLLDGRVLMVGGTSGTFDAWVNTDSVELFDPATNTFSPAASLHLGRSEHTATLLPDGRVLVTGGSRADDNLATRTAEIYDPALDQWTDLGDVLQAARWSHTATLLRDGRVLIAGGWAAGGASFRTAEVFDPGTNVSSLTGQMAKARKDHTATLLPSGRVLITGGVSSNAVTPGSEEFDPTTGTWTPGFVTAGAGNATATLLASGDVLIADGRAPSTAVATKKLYHPGYGEMTPAASTSLGRQSWMEVVTLPSGDVLALGGSETQAERYHPATDSWSAAGTMQWPQINTASVVLSDGRVLVTGGDNNNPVSELYDPATNGWSLTGAPAVGRIYHTANLLSNGLVLIAGGDNLGTTYATTELYDPATNTWTGAASMAAPRSRAASVVLPDGRVLVCGGIQIETTPSTQLASCELYDVASNTWALTGPMGQARNAFKLLNLPNGKVLAVGGAGYVPQTELYDPAAGTWTPSASELFNHNGGTAALLPSGNVVAVGGADQQVELYSWVTGTWRQTGSLAEQRQFSPLAVLPSGWVVVTGGRVWNTLTQLTTTELYVEPPDVSAVQPVIDPPGTVTAGQPFTLTGSRFLGGTEANGGDTSSSPSNFPVVTLEPSGGGPITPLPSSSFADGQISLTAPDGLSGPYVLTVSVNGISTTASATLQANQPPTADDQAVNLSEDGAVDVTVTGSDPEGATLTFALGTGPANGTLTFTGPDQFHYVPDADFNGTDSFTFTATDDLGQSATGTITLSVASVNDAPIASNGSGSCPEDSSCAFPLSGSDPEGDALTFVIVTPPEHGTIALNTAPNIFLYTPAPNYNGPDSFTFKVNDGTVDSTVATFSVTVPARNDQPVANAQTVSVNEDGSVDITLLGSDVDGDTLQYIKLSDPTQGTLVLKTAPNVYTYTPQANFNGADSFTFNVYDGTLYSTAATITLQVQAVNDAPVADDASASTGEDTTTVIALSASDLEGDSLQYTIVQGPSHGTVSFSAGPNQYSYTPEANYNGPDSFTFHVYDGTTFSNDATVTLDVTAVNDAPVVADLALTSDEDTALHVTPTAVDPEGDAVTFVIVTQPAHGTVTGNSPDFVYTPEPGYFGLDSFTVTGSDGTDTSMPATVTITVSAVNDAPVATAQTVQLPEDGSAAVTLAGTDEETDVLTFTVVTPPAHGTLSGAAPNLSYTPNPDFTGEDSFTFLVNDGSVDSAPATVTLKVGGSNDAPVAKGLSVQTGGAPVAVTLAGTDVDGDALQYTVLASPTHGTLSGTAPDLTYTPAPGFFGTDSFTFKVNDGQVDSAPATVTVDVVQGANNAPGTPKLAFPAGEDKVAPGQVQLGWSTSVDPDGDAVSYRVEVLQGDQVVATAQTESLTASVGPLSEGSYTWRVTAVDAKGMASAPSELRAFTVLPLEVAGGCTAAPGSSAPLTGMVMLALLLVPFWRRGFR